MMDKMNMDLGKAIDNKLDRTKWKKWKFSDLVENIVEKVVPKDSGLEHYIGLEHLDSGSLHIKRFGETASLIGDKLKIYKNDIIFAKRNAYLKRVSIAPFDAVASAHSMVLRPKLENVLAEFLPFFLLSEKFWERAIEISVGSLSPTINWKALAKQEFLLPPKDQQAQLAELLWAMDEVIERENVVLQNTQALLEAVRRKLNTGDLREFSGEKITNLITKGASPKWQGFDYCDEGVLFVTSENVLEDSIDLKEKKYLPIAFHEKQKRSKLKKGDILINIVGASIGRLAVFNEEFENANINQAVCLFRLKEEIAKPEYIVNYLLEETNKTRLLNNQSATARPNLSLTNLNEYKFFLPRLEQQEIRLKGVLSIKSALDDTSFKISSSKALQKSLINQVF
jgi:type I restriction enzyme S subunit